MPNFIVSGIVHGRWSRIVEASTPEQAIEIAESWEEEPIPDELDDWTVEHAQEIPPRKHL